MKKQPSLFLRTLSTSGLVFALDFVSKELALWNLAPSPTAADAGLVGIRLMKSADVSIGGTLIPNVALALLYIVIASVFLSAAFGSHLFLPPRLKAWPLGLGLSAGGFFANAIDRALHGTLTDLVSINLGSLGLKWELLFNVADIGEALGAALLVYGLAGAFIGEWSEERRGKLLIERGYQFRFCLYLQAAMTIGFAPMFLSALFLLGSNGGSTLPAGLRLSFLLIAPLAYASLTMICWSAGIAVSHRTAGAVVKFCKTAVIRLNRPIRKRDEEIFSLRVGDEFRPRFEDVMRNIDLLRKLVEKMQKPKPPEAKGS